MKKKAKKSSGKKVAGKATTKKNVDVAKVREEIAGLVKSGAKEITEAVIDQAMHGELAPAKYLFEVAGVYPPAIDGSLSTNEEDSLAKTLLDRLNVPDKPVVADQEDDDEIVIAPATRGDSRRDKREIEDKADEKEAVGV